MEVDTDKNEYFSEEILHYGWDNFKHEIVANGLSFEDACRMEIGLIKSLKTNCREFGYNEEKGGLGENRVSDSMRERSKERQLKRFEDPNERIRQSQRIKEYFSRPGSRERQSAIISQYYVEHPESRKPVRQYALDGEFVREFGSAWETGRHGFDPSHVKACCKGHRRTAGGYIWRYSDELQNKAI